jgi:hypothetical protein
MKSASSMMRLRMFMGLTSALHGLGALKFPTRTAASPGWSRGPRRLDVRRGPSRGGLLMAYAAAREWGGERRRRCRVISSFTLAVTWIAVFFNS